jgi:hypothetical protein
MAVAFIQEWRDPSPGTDNYDAVASKLDAQNNPPEGLIAHTAGRDGSGVWRVFDIWESPEHAERFREERLMPIVRQLMEDRPDATPPDVVDTYELHDVFVVR